MTISVLIVDADEEYRELTAKTLDSTGQYRSFPAQSARAALSMHSEAKPQIAIIDTDLPDMDGVEFIHKLLQLDKHLLIIAIVEDETTQSPTLEPLGVRLILEKPYYLPGLPDMIKSAIQRPAKKAALPPRTAETPVKADAKGEGIPGGWLANPDQTSEVLTRLFREHSALALMILRGRSPYAQSSHLSEDDASLIARLVLENLPEDNLRESIVRYIRLNDFDGDILLYTAALVDDFVLVLLYDSDKSFSLARRQAKYLSKLILMQDPLDLPALETSPEDKATAVPREQVRSSSLPDDWIPQTPASVEDLLQLTDLEIPSAGPEPGEEGQLATSAPVPSEVSPFPADWLPKRPMPPAHLPFLASENIDQTRHIEAQAAAEDIGRDRQIEAQTAPEDIGHVRQTEAQAPPEEHYEACFQLPFSSVLIPQNPTHQFDDALAGKMKDWIEDICLAWGWRADKVEITPHYLHLTLYLSPETAPSDAIQGLSQALSGRILEANPQFSNDLTAGQFWAKHYLLIAGEGIDTDRISTFEQAVRQNPGPNPLTNR